jgi:hypothetical protein
MGFSAPTSLDSLTVRSEAALLDVDILWSMTSVDGDTARRLIHEQNQLARSRLSALLAKQHREVRGVTATITPWVGRAWVRGRAPHTNDLRYADPRYANDRNTVPYDFTGVTGHLRPQMRRALQDAYGWAQAAHAETERWNTYRPILDSRFFLRVFRHGPRPPGFDGWRAFDRNGWEMTGNDTFEDSSVARRIKDLVQPGTRYARDYLEKEVREVHQLLDEFAAKLAAYQVPEQVLPIPDVVHPPRHCRLKDGMLARLVAEDIAGHLAAGRLLDKGPNVGTASPANVLAWTNTVDATLAAGLIDDVQEGFWRLVMGAPVCDTPGTDSVALSRAYLTLGLTYLEEVLERMPDYAAASGQTPPQPSLAIHDSTFYGQVAAQITNIDSTIAGIAHMGSQDVADALKALEKAVLGQTELDNAQRQELLDIVADLADAARTPPENRSRGRIKSALAYLTTAATGAADLGKALDAWQPTLHKLLP